LASTFVAVVGRARGRSPFFTWAAIVALLVVFAGFAPTYYLKGMMGGEELDTMRHVHGVVMTAWFVLFFVQARLVATGRTPVHRQLGAAGLVVAALVIGVSMALAIAAVRAGRAPAGIPPLIFLVLPVGEMVAFGTLFGAAVALRKRSDWHKRLMVLASLSMLSPAIARLPLDFIKTGGPPAFFAVVDLVLIAFIAIDTIKNRRLHPAFLTGFVFIVFIQIGRLALSGTEAWTSFAKWLVA
jgi:hypothetical protein